MICMFCNFCLMKWLSTCQTFFISFMLSSRITFNITSCTIQCSYMQCNVIQVVVVKLCTIVQLHRSFFSLICVNNWSTNAYVSIVYTQQQQSLVVVVGLPQKNEYLDSGICPTLSYLKRQEHLSFKSQTPNTIQETFRKFVVGKKEQKNHLFRLNFYNQIG